MTFPAQDRLVRKEEALGTIREMEPPKTHIGTRLLAPMTPVDADDVIFDYATVQTDGLAPARAEDAEAELAQKDEYSRGLGRASVIDWSLKDHYTASDVTRYQEQALLAQQLGSAAGTTFPLTVGSSSAQFRNKVVKDDALRRRKLDNRIEWLIMTAMETGGIAYNDGKIRFSVDYGRPSNQTDEAPASGNLWSLAASDPIGDILAIKRFMRDTYGVTIDRAILSGKIIENMMNSNRFGALSGMVGATGSLPIDLNYLKAGWGPEAAKELIARTTGVTFIEYDAVYRTRPVGSTTITNNRFFSENKILFLPSDQDIAEMDDGLVGFGATLTSPHPEGNWTSGFYEWEQSTKDPWGTDRGTGIKAFPVFPHLEYTYTMVPLA